MHRDGKRYPSCSKPGQFLRLFCTISALKTEKEVKLTVTVVQCWLLQYYSLQTQRFKLIGATLATYNIIHTYMSALRTYLLGMENGAQVRASASDKVYCVSHCQEHVKRNTTQSRFITKALQLSTRV